MLIQDITMTAKEDIEMQSYIIVNHAGVIEICQDFTSHQPYEKGSSIVPHEVTIELQDLVDSFVEDLDEEDTKESIRDLETMAAEFDFHAANLREKAELMRGADDGEIQLEIEFDA